MFLNRGMSLLSYSQHFFSTEALATATSTGLASREDCCSTLCPVHWCPPIGLATLSNSQTFQSCSLVLPCESLLGTPRGCFGPHEGRSDVGRIRKILVSVNFFPQFWGWKWLRQFYGHLEKCALSAGKPMSKKFLVLGEGILGFFGGGGGADFIYIGARDFSDRRLSPPHRGIALAKWCLHHSLHRSGTPQRECKSQWESITSQRWFSVMHIALHKSLALVPSKALKSRDSNRGLHNAHRVADLHRAIWSTFRISRLSFGHFVKQKGDANKYMG